MRRFTDFIYDSIRTRLPRVITKRADRPSWDKPHQGVGEIARRLARIEKARAKRVLLAERVHTTCIDEGKP